MPLPQFWIVAGANGAGKTTIAKGAARHLLPNTRLLNPDEIAMQLLKRSGIRSYKDATIHQRKSAFIKGAEKVLKDASERLARGESVCVETVLSTEKYRPLVKRLLRAHGFLGLIYIALSDPKIACRRVAARVRRGGHGVPRDRIIARWKKSIDQLPWFARRATFLVVYDNSDENPNATPPLIAEGLKGKVKIHRPDALPILTQALRKLRRKQD